VNVTKDDKQRLEGELDTSHRVVLTSTCLKMVRDAIAQELDNREEGISYLIGLTDAVTTLAIFAMKPRALTTWGSFSVDQNAMAKIVRKACDYGLQVVGQVHTHPGEAFHSDGDEQGARIRYSGYASIVIPEYGRWLPELDGVATYMYLAKRGFIRIAPSQLIVVSEVSGR
jgi:proteasome lid subunit RPN8/RPN11